MELISIKFLNYRNLDGLETSLNKDINFVLGENNIGKSNFQNGIYIVLSGKSFNSEDFKNEDCPIRIDMKFYLSDEEIGIFDDLVDPTDTNCINIKAVQETPDDYIKYSHIESGETIPVSLIRRINVITYDSLRNPKNEIDFNKTKGAGAFLHYIVNKYVEEYGDKGLLKKTEVRKIEKYMSGALNKMSVFNRFAINPSVEINEKEIVSRILFLKDENSISVSNSGYGVQFNILIILSLLERIIEFSKKRKEYEDEFSALLIFDEPEIHLHPYLQRTMIKDIIALANGSDENFNKLLSEFFGINKISAQIIVTTHSPNMLSNDYQKIIRMYRKDDKTKAVSCVDLNLSYKERKHLLMQFDSIKEAFFARAAIIVEGDSEYGSFRGFSEKLGIDFDRLGIALIKAGGADSILTIIRVLNQLRIKSVGVIDKDKKIEKKLPDREDLFYTKTKCFDSEVVNRAIHNKNYELLKKILLEYDDQKLEREMKSNKLENIISKYGFHKNKPIKSYRFKDINETHELFEVMYVAWFDINKGIMLGKMIGSTFEKKDIPPCYVKAIRKVKEFSNE